MPGGLLAWLLLIPLQQLTILPAYRVSMAYEPGSQLHGH
jgi:hypothetical protein